MSIIGDIFIASDQIDNGRSLNDIMLHSMTEIGELTEELIIKNGRSYKDGGDDGIVGEAIDVILCMVDMIRIHSPETTEEELRAIASKKLDKWVEKYSEL